MAKSFLPADLPKRDSDVELPADDLLRLSFFARLSDGAKDKLRLFPGYMRLRRYRRGEVICRQGDEDCTAFFILRDIDLLQLKSALSGQAEATRENQGMRSLLDSAVNEIPAARREQLQSLHESMLGADGHFKAAAQSQDKFKEARLAGEKELKRLTAEAEKSLAKEQAALLKQIATAKPAKKLEHAVALEGTNASLAALIRELAAAQDGDAAGKAECDKQRAKSLELLSQASAQPRVFAGVYLATAARPTVKHGGNWFDRIKRKLAGQRKHAREEGPRYLPFDGPREIDNRTRQTTLNEGELFGEMACLTRRPRSATVVADREGYLLEMLSNVLDEIDKDPAYQKERDEIYRNRVLDLHLRDLALFRELSDEQFAEIFKVVRPQVELLRLSAGQILCDEHDRSDALYIVREGLVQIKKGVSALLSSADILDWPGLVKLLSAETGAAAAIRKLLPADVQPGLAGGEVDAKVIYALNDLLKNHKLVEAVELREVVAGEAFRKQTADLPVKPGDRTEHPQRLGNRYLLEAIVPAGILRRYQLPVGPEVILTYLSRGDYIGEIGLIKDQPRNATCVAFGQPPRSHYGSDKPRLVWKHKPYKPSELTYQKPEEAEDQKSASRVELVKISRELFWHMVEAFPVLRQKIDIEIARREQQTTEKMKTQAIYETPQDLYSAEASRLGLVQGQKLMLIDLERCTRCDECVKACVEAHDDGHTRLHLFGQRFDKYLVPTACRACLDPVCMIGCPVRSIQRGDNHQMEIKDWCIGCAKCAKQCPYDSIQMHPLDEAGTPEPAANSNQVEVSTRAVVCDLCSSLASQDPACVYACPHEAAIRFDAQTENSILSGWNRRAQT
jgi:Fe-S-cluster-containing hydrogenase component 2